MIDSAENVANKLLSANQPDVRVLSSKSWAGLGGFVEVIHFTDLIRMLVYRNLVSVYKQTILGSAWHIAQPLASTLVFTFIFGTVISAPTDGAPPFLFYIVGTTAWGFFASCLSNTADTFTANVSVFSKVYFPRIAVPISVVLTNLARLAPQSLTVVIAVAPIALTGDSVAPRWPLLPLLPVLLLLLGALAMGVGLLCSAFTIRFRDLQVLMNFGVQLMMYATPVVYPLSAVPEKWRPLAALNPVAPLIEAVRHIVLGAGEIRIMELAVSTVLTLLLFILGGLAFFRAERTSMDTV